MQHIVPIRPKQVLQPIHLFQPYQPIQPIQPIQLREGSQKQVRGTDRCVYAERERESR